MMFLAMHVFHLLECKDFLSFFKQFIKNVLQLLQLVFNRWVHAYYTVDTRI